MILFQLFWAFFQIGLVSFGGGYVIIPLLRGIIESNGWISAKEFADIVAISQMTPGPIAVNAATYIGVRTAGVMGSTVSTFGISLPSFLIILFIAHFFTRFQESRLVKAVLKGIRPVTIGLIGSAIFFFAEMSIFTAKLPLDKLHFLFVGQWSRFFEGVSIRTGAVVIFAVVLIAVKKFKLNPILAVVCSAILGILLL